ncbi:MAG: putative aminopeptidase YsdC [candidate division WS2 bacterium]|nr:putative aminopeptidase YsdC [Candidatus Lithacetigena glycinireducens]
MLTEDLNLLTTLLNTPGVVGYEEPIRLFIEKEVQKYTDDVRIDSLGNIIAVVKGNKGVSTTMFMAHMDELGLVVSAIDKKGYLSFQKLGGIDDRILVSTKVRILSDKGEVAGIIGLKPPHLMIEPQEKDKTTPFHQLKIDIGVKTREEALALGIKIGTPMVFTKDFFFLNSEDLICCRGIDDRLGCYTLIKLLHDLKENPPENTVVIAFTTEEEIGLRGAMVLGPQFNPDIAIACDSISSPDFPGVASMYEGSFEVGGGPTLRVVDNRMVAGKELIRFMEKIASRVGVTLQYGVSGGSTDASAVETAYKGYKAIPVCFPVRYTHSTVEVSSLKDIDGLIKLYSAITREPIDLT